MPFSQIIKKKPAASIIERCIDTETFVWGYDLLPGRYVRKYDGWIYSICQVYIFSRRGTALHSHVVVL